AELARLGADPRAEAGVSAGILEHGAQAAAVHESDHRLIAQRFEGDGLTATELMTAANAEHERLDSDHAETDLGRERLDHADDPGVNVAVDQRLEQRLVVLAAERDL